MLLTRQNAVLRESVNLHGGSGIVRGKIFLADYARKAGGFKLIHDNIIPPGVSIGEHTHIHDEEIYMILEGDGQMLIDGVMHPVTAGDVCLTRPGHSHALTNTGSTNMRLLVVGVNPQPV